jgi:transposase
MGHWEVTTLIGALGLDGVRASFAVESATDTDVFRTFLVEVLVPALRPGDVVIWDNLPAHKDAQCAALVEQAGAHVLRLPPYSPDFNPIESCWSKIKERLRSEAARTKEALDRAIASSFAAITSQDAKGWFRLCGYQPSS